jgi:hypothetical protein
MLLLLCSEIPSTCIPYYASMSIVRDRIIFVVWLDCELRVSAAVMWVVMC